MTYLIDEGNVEKRLGFVTRCRSGRSLIAVKCSTVKEAMLNCRRPGAVVVNMHVFDSLTPCCPIDIYHQVTKLDRIRRPGRRKHRLSTRTIIYEQNNQSRKLNTEHLLRTV